MIKLCAAGAMLVDHVNWLLFLGTPQGFIWRIGRISFPCFCLAVALNLFRGVELPRYLGVLVILAIASQPIFAFAFKFGVGNVLFTLALGAVIAQALLRWPAIAQHVFLASVTFVAFAAPEFAGNGLDFGIAGACLPAALLLVVNRQRWHLPWAVLLTYAVSWSVERPTKSLLEPLIDGSVGVAALAVVLFLVAPRFINQPRFLPKYALHVFYPGHLFVLGVANRFVQ
jgi:TraX protein